MSETPREKVLPKWLTSHDPIDYALIGWTSMVLATMCIMIGTGHEIPGYLQGVFATLTSALGFKKALS